MSQLSNSIPENCHYYEEQKVKIQTRNLIPANSKNYQIDETKLDSLLSDLTNIPIQLVLPKTHMRLMSLMYDSQLRDFERITHSGFEYFDNMVKLMYFPFFPNLGLGYTSKVEQKITPREVKFKLRLVA